MSTNSLKAKIAIKIIIKENNNSFINIIAEM